METLIADTIPVHEAFLESNMEVIIRVIVQSSTNRTWVFLISAAELEEETLAASMVLFSMA